MLEKIYQVSIALRRFVLLSVFGWVSECKHTPTCGRYTLDTIKSEGLVIGIVKGCSRILRCW